MTLSTPCRDCDRASKGLWHGITANCRGCQARSVGRLPQFFRVRKRLQVDSAYLAVLAGVFGCDPKDEKSWRPVHEEVKAAFGQDAMYQTWRAGEAS